jgi:hypothetical protein
MNKTKWNIEMTNLSCLDFLEYQLELDKKYPGVREKLLKYWTKERLLKIND